MKKILRFLLVTLAAVGTGALIGGYAAVMDGLPQIAELKSYRPSNGTKVFADDDRFIAEFNVEKGIYVPYERFPESLVQAAVATEDAEFWRHSGINLFAIGRAVVKDILAGRIKEGGSTITQQLAKVLFLSPEKKLKRKLQEVVLAFQMEKNLSKEEILELYFNKIYFGRGAYGVEMAARTYFGKSVDALDLAESAMLVGLIRAPNRYSPYHNLARAKRRQRVVLRRMVREGYIGEEELETAFAEPLRLENRSGRREGNSYFLEALRKDLEERYGTETLYKGGLRVYTTLNLEMQRAAREALRWGLRRFDKKLGWRGPLEHRDPAEGGKRFGAGALTADMLESDRMMPGLVIRVDDESAEVLLGGRTGLLRGKDAKWAAVRSVGPGETETVKPFRLSELLRPGDVIHVSVRSRENDILSLRLEQMPEIEGALVALEPQTGYVKALVGGYDFHRSEFNRAVAASRQPGSAFKPVIYTAALDRGFTPADMILDEPVEYSDYESGIWEPSNYNRKHYGPTRLRDALAFSRNIITVKLLDMIGIPAAVRTARKLGIDGPLPHDLTLGLGSLSVTPIRLTSVYATFANGGVRVPTTQIRYILDAKGNLVENNIPEGERVLSPETAYLITSMLEDVVRYGTGWRAKALKRPVAGKTGTTNEYRDAWFLGFTPDLAAGVWVGHDDTRTMGKRATGSSVSAPIWTRFMKKALKGTEPREFPIPEGIVTAIIDADTGLLATTDTPKRTIEFFREGEVPEIYSTAGIRADILSLRESGRVRNPDND